MRHVGDIRQKQFMKTFEVIVEKKLSENKQESCVKKCCRIFIKILIGLVIVAIVSPMLYGMY